MPVQLVLGLGPMWTLRTGERPIAVTRDLVLLELRLIGESRAANRTTLWVVASVDLAMHDQVVFGREVVGAVGTLEAGLPVGVVDLALVGLEKGFWKIIQ